MPKKFTHGDIANILISRDGVTRSLSQWATVLGIPYTVVRMRYKRGKRTFEELLGPKGTQGVRVSIDTTEGETRVTQVEHTFLDDLLTHEVADQVREIAKQAGMSPVQVVVKIVEKKAAELLAPQPQTQTS